MGCLGCLGCLSYLREALCVMVSFMEKADLASGLLIRNEVLPFLWVDRVEMLTSSIVFFFTNLLLIYFFSLLSINVVLLSMLFSE